MPYINIGGINTHYYQNCDFIPNLPSLIFVHGAGGTGQKWVHQLAGIPDYNLIALDLPGHGLSEGSAADEIIAYREFVGRFAQALGLKQFVLAGHSMGGAIALDLALAMPGALKGLIIVDSGARLRVNPMVLEMLAKDQYPLDTVKYSYSSKTSPDILEKATEEMKKVATKVMLADFKACNGFDIKDRIQAISNPALILCGQDDALTPLKYSEYLHEKLPHSTLAIIREAGHMAMLEQPDQVNLAINNFLTESILHS